MTNKNVVPDVWDQDWFLALHVNHQLFYLYITAKCNMAGIWRPNKTNFEKTRDIRIDLSKFLEAVNQKEARITVLRDNTWFLNYHISDTIGRTYKPTYSKMVKALKIAFESGIPLQWISGFVNHDKIDKELIENSYMKTTTQFVSKPHVNAEVDVGATHVENFTSETPKVVEKDIRLKGTAPGFMMPTLKFMHYGDDTDDTLESWLLSTNFTKFIQIRNIRSPEDLKSNLNKFIKVAQSSTKLRTVEEMGEWFNNWYRKNSSSNGIVDKQESFSNDADENKFASINKVAAQQQAERKKKENGQ